MAVAKVPNKILIGDTYHEEIRGRLGVDDSIVTDVDIDAPSVLPIAEVRIIKDVPNYESLTGDDQLYLYAAAVSLVAAILAPSMGARIKKSKKDFDFTIENEKVNWSARSDQLQDEAYSFLNMISTQTVANLPMMGVSGPTRAKTPSHNPTIIDGDVHLWSER